LVKTTKRASKTNAYVNMTAYYIYCRNTICK